MKDAFHMKGIHMRGEMNLNRYEVSFRLAVSFRCSVSSLHVCTWIEAKWNSDRYGFHICHLDRNEISNWHAVFMWKNLPETKWISVNSLDIAFNEHVRLKLIAVILTEMKFAYACPSKYQVVLKCNWNETSCQQNFFHTGLKSQSGISSFQGCSALKINRRANKIASNIWLNNWCFLQFIL